GRLEGRPGPAVRRRQAQAAAAPRAGSTLGDGRGRCGHRADRRRRRIPLWACRRRVIFVDTSFWIALRFARDQRHDEAVELLRRSTEASLVTSNQVRGESWTLLRRRAGHASAVHFLDRLERTRRLRVMFVSDDLERQALRWLRRRDEQP